MNDEPTRLLDSSWRGEHPRYCANCGREMVWLKPGELTYSDDMLPVMRFYYGCRNCDTLLFETYVVREHIKSS